jgi:hypothetical protein
MAVYQITTPSGAKYRIEGPENASEDALIRAAKQYEFAERRREIDALSAVPPEPPETTVGGNIKETFKGIVPGAVNLAETAGTGITALLPEDTEKAARSKLAEIAGAIKKPFEAAPGYEDSVGRKLGEGLGSTGPFFALAPFGIAGVAAGVGLGAAAGAGEARQRAEAEGITGSDRALATALGIGPGLFDALAPSLNIGKTLITRAFLRGGIEGATEAAQAVAQNLIAKGVYNPDQPIFVGAGEQGAYGAGVGALASVLIDLTLGRRARTTTTPGGEPPSTAPAAPTTTPGLSSGIPSGLSSGVPFSATQPDLFPGDLRTAETAVQPPAPAPAGTQKELFTPEEAPVPPTGPSIPSEPPAAATQLDMFAPQRAEQPVPEQRDLIDEAETAQLAEMERIDRITPEVASRNEAEIARLRAGRAVEQEKNQLQFESDLAETDARGEESQRKESEAQRLEILQPLIENIEVKNIPKAFRQALGDQGFTNLDLTPREQKLINRAYDVRLAIPFVPESEPDVTAEETAELASEIPARTETVAQEQPSFPGMGKPKGTLLPDIADVEMDNTTITPKTLDALGVLKAAPMRQSLVGKDIADTQQRIDARNLLVSYVENPNVNPRAKVKILTFLRSPLFRVQADMFGPRGKVLEPTKPPSKKEAPSDATGRKPDTDTTTVNTGSGVSPVVRGKGRGERVSDTPADTGTAKTPKRSGLGDSGQSAGVVGERKGSEQGALKKPKADAGEQKGSEQGAPKKPKADIGKYLTNAADNQDAALDALAYDIYMAMFEKKKLLNSVEKLNDILAELRNNKMPELSFGREGVSSVPGTGGKYAKNFYESLSDSDRNALMKKLETTFEAVEKDIRRGTAWFNNSQLTDRATREQFDADLLEKEVTDLVRPLHPVVVDTLRAGNLGGALRFVAAQRLGRSSDIAQRLSEVLGDAGIEVEIVNFAKPESSATLRGMQKAGANLNNVSGAYVTSSKGRRILLLDSKTGLDVWSLLHESTHAATQVTLRNASHPLTKQLTQLFDTVKGSLDGAYGATDVEEFAAEAFSNPEFQQKLAAINLKGEPITAWQRFTNSIGNLLRSLVGLPTKPLGSALTATDSLVDAVINGPSGVGTPITTVSLLQKDIGKVIDGIGKRAANLPGLNQDRVNLVRDIFSSNIPGTTKNIVRQSLPLNALVEVAEKYIPMARKLDDLVNLRSGSENQRNQKIEATNKRVEDWAKSNRDRVDTLNAVVYDSTINQVDPSKPRKEYAGKTDDSGNKLDAVWDKLQPQWNALGAPGRDIYKQMRDTYKALYGEVQDVLFARIDDSVGDKQTAKRIKDEVYRRLFSSGHIEPYFPLTRRGDKWLSYTLDGEFYVESFETNAARDDVAKELKAGGASDVQKFANIKQINYRRAPSTSFVNDVLRSLEVNKVDPQVTEEVMRLFLNTLPETSFAQALRRRKGTAGFERDALRALRTKTFNISRQLSNMEYGAKFNKLRQEMEDYVRSQGNQDEAVDMMNELSARIDFAMSPTVPKWAQLATSFGFNMTLGFNVSSAVVNLSQVPLVVMPYLGGKYGYTDTTKAIGRATRLLTNSGLSRDGESIVEDEKGSRKVKMKAFLSMDNYDFNAPGAPKHLKTLVEYAAARGQLNRSQIYDILDVTEDRGLLTKINAVSGGLFHYGERINRQVSLIAAYELELQKLIGAGKSFDSASQDQREKAAEQAVYVTELTNGGVAAASAPRLTQNPIGKIVFMYKRYGVSMYYLLFKTARDTLNGDKPEGMSDTEWQQVRKAAKRQIAGIYGMAGLMAGAQGVPLFGVAAMLYNLIVKEEDDDDFDTAARKYLGEGIYSGAINALTGTEVASRIGLSDLLFRDTTTRASDNLLTSVAEMMGGPVLGSAMRIERGLKLIADGELQRGIEQILPSAFGNVAKSIRYANEGALTLRGDPIIGELSSANVFAQVFGFAPAEYTRQLEINATLKGFDRDTNERRTKLLRKYYIALRMGDSSETQNVLKDILKFNARYPTNAITPSTIKSSMAQHMKTSGTMYHGITISKAMRPEIMRRVDEYDDEME